MEITDDQYSDRCFPSITLSVKFIQTDNVSYADRNNPWVKLLNFVVIMYNRQYNRQQSQHKTVKNDVELNL